MANSAEVAAFMVRKEYAMGAQTKNCSGQEFRCSRETNLLQQKYRLDNSCSNNQSEKLAITKSLEAIERHTSRKIDHALQE